MDEIRKQFGKQMRQARKEHGWTQEELGERFGCSQRTISDIERGVTAINAADVPRLACILGKDILYFYPASAEWLDPNLLPIEDAELLYAIRYLSHPIKEQAAQFIRALGKQEEMRKKKEESTTPD